MRYLLSKQNPNVTFQMVRPDEATEGEDETA
jgi:hypothetical protein